MDDVNKEYTITARLETCEAECTGALCAFFKLAALFAKSGEGDEHHERVQRYINEALIYGGACGVTGGAATKEEAEVVIRIRELLAGAAVGASQAFKAEKAH